MSAQKDKALGLAELGLKVFPCRSDRTPYTEDGFYAGTDVLRDVEEAWTKHPDALPGVWCGASGLVVLDIDFKNGKDGYASLEENFYVPDPTFHYSSIGGEGEHWVYLAPVDVNLPPMGPYRKMPGIDRRSGGSYVVWAGPVPESTEEFSPAPEWLCDPLKVRSSAAFEGSVQEWFEALEPGSPNLPVRGAIDRISDDMSHQDMVALQYEAVRLGAEGNPGVPDLLALIEKAWLARPPENHTTPEEKWEHKFAEALESGIEKHGATIALREMMPPFVLASVPVEVPVSMVTGTPGGHGEYNALLASLVRATDDDLLVLSILWNSPKTRDVAREWSLEFNHTLVAKARDSAPAVTENPSLERRESKTTAETALLTSEQEELVRAYPTFIDEYLAATETVKGWSNLNYAIPAAWTLLSMTFGRRAWVPMGKPFPMNMWFLVLGESGSGKAQPLHSRVLTPTGFKQMGDMHEGDLVVTPSGDQARVVGVYPQGVRPVYYVTLSDGRVVEADEDHLWTVTRAGTRYRERTETRTTKELINDLTCRGSKKYKWFINRVSPVDLGSWGSTIDPYSLGALLGDGSLTSYNGYHTTRITGEDEEVLDHFRSNLPPGLRLVKQGGTITYGISGDTRGVRNPWTVELERLGIAGSGAREKHIPNELLHSSVADRLALLQGLMDTDGTPSQNGNSADVVFASKQLRDDVVWIVRSLGGKGTVSTKEVQLKGWDEPRTYYRAYLTLPREYEFFRLTRKKNKINAGGKYDLRALSIRAIEFKGYEETQCIRVDHPDHEYVTDGFTRTHNTSEQHVLKTCLDLLLKDEDQAPYNLGANSSPEAMHDVLIARDNLPSMILHDEASDFFDNLRHKEWMSGSKDLFSKWYDGFVDPVNKVRMKDLKGRSAHTSFSVNMMATPDRLLGLVDTSMFETGFLARFCYVWDGTPESDEHEFEITRSEVDSSGCHPALYSLVSDLLMARKAIGQHPVAMHWAPEAEKTLVSAHRRMKDIAKKYDEWDALEPAVKRLGREYLWKSASLLALYRGDTTISEMDALTAVFYAQTWFATLLRVVEAAGQGEFSSRMDAVEAFVRRYPGGVTSPRVYDKFKGFAKYGRKDVDSVIEYLILSGRILERRDEGKVKYLPNGG